MLTCDRILLPSTISAYKSFCKKKNHPLGIVDIPNTDIPGFWIGNKDAEYAMVYYHGGGFVMPGTGPHLDMLMKWVQWSNNKLAIFCAAYTLAPEKVYPTQISQSVEALRYVLSQPGRSPSKTLLGGDSAGGNLVIAVLSHISGHAHPQANIVKPLDLSEKLYGGVTIAPWTSSDDSRFASMTQFRNRDIVGPVNAHYWTNTYKGHNGAVADDEYIVPEIANPNWWSSSKISSFLVVAGEHESLRDAIVSWSEKFQKGAPDVDFKLVIGKRETHDAPLQPRSDAKLAGHEADCQEAAIKSWISTHFV